MKKEIIDLIKKIRINLKLTQKEFASKLSVTEMEIKEFENYEKLPDFEFIVSVCEKFDLSIDYFLKNPIKTSLTNNLIVTQKNGKCAIFDISNSTYLIPNIFSEIILSKTIYHTANINEMIKKENEELKKIISYSAVIDNSGNIFSFPNIEFNEKSIFNFNNTCPAFYKQEKKYNLFKINKLNDDNNLRDVEFSKLGEGFDFIYNVISPFNVPNFEFFGLYWVQNSTKKVNDNENKDETTIRLIDCNGNNINCTLTNELDFLHSKVEELNEIDTIIDWIVLYGPNVISLIPEEIFLETRNYVMIVWACAKFAKNYKDFSLEIILYAVKILEKFTYYLNPKHKKVLFYETYKPELFIIKKSDEDKAILAIKDLFSKINLDYGYLIYE